MPYWPECEYEYPKRLEQCPICASSLVDRLKDESSWLCDECKEEVPKDAMFCQVCGTIFIESLRCFSHPDDPAHGSCVVCGKYLCLECGIRRLGQYFCKKHGLLEELPLKDEFLQKAEDREAWSLHGFFVKHGLECRILSRGKDDGLFLGKEFPELVKVIIPSKDRTKAQLCIKTHSVNEEQVLFQCERCSALSNFEYESCTNCDGP